MNKTFVISFIVGAAVFTGSFSSCQDYDPFDYETVRKSVIDREYTQNFEVRYGKIDPDHTWGFGAITLSGDEMTRSGNTNVEKNLWEAKYHLQIPGWPDVYTDNSGSHNHYHYAGNGDNLDKGWSDAKPNPSSYLPAGDVTDEEIQYVSWYFRTHSVGREPIHCSDFFIQEISSDNDRDAQGKVITQMPIYKDGVIVGYENVEKWGLEQMEALNIEGVTSGVSIEGYDHINNFNQGTSNNLAGQEYAYMGSNPALAFTNGGQAKVDTPHRMIQFYATAGTEDFMVKCTQEAGNTATDKWYNNWALVHLVFDGPSGRHYDGYYLGFDYACEKTPTQDGKMTKYTFDGRYSNWIVKLTPAVPLENTSFSRRIMCEDLGNTYDFDFNDVVFDATYNLQDYELQGYKEGDEVDVTITLRASGGTLPIYVGKDPTTSSATSELGRYESHHMLALNNSETPINVGPKGVNRTIATYHITQHSLDPDDIRIWVRSYDGSYYQIDPVKGGNLSHYNGGDRVQPGAANYYVAPQKFAVPVGVSWMQECEFIEDGYTYFEDWVSNHKFLDPDHNRPWYDILNIKNPQLITGDTGVSAPTTPVTPGAPTLSASDLALSTSSVHIDMSAVGADATATLQYTTSSTGSLSFSSTNAGAVSLSYDATSKTITVKTSQEITSPVTVTVLQASDGTYSESSRSFTVTSSVVVADRVYYSFNNLSFNNASCEDKTITFKDMYYAACVWDNNLTTPKGGTYHYLVLEIESSDCNLKVYNKNYDKDTKLIVIDVSSIDENNIVRLEVIRESGKDRDQVVFKDIYLTNTAPSQN